MSNPRLFQEDPYSRFCNDLAPAETPKQDLGARMNARKPKTDGAIKTVTRLKDEFEKKVNEFYQAKASKPSSSNHGIHQLSDLMKNNFVIGEYHEEVAAKKFMIDNMKALKNAGYRTLYFEHLYYDDQKLLDEYCKTGNMPDKLKQRLNEVDENHSRILSGAQKELWNKYSFTAVVMAAKEAGIRVVAIDVKAVYEQQKTTAAAKDENLASSPNDAKQRMRHMNYTASQIIQREEKMQQGGKWLAFMGNMHVNRHHDTPGVADLFGVPSVYAVDSKDKKATATVEYATRIKRDNDYLSGDVMLTICPDAASPSLPQAAAPDLRRR